MDKEKNYAIDALKLLFIVVIVLHHSRQISEVLIRGYIGVEFFFIISGVLLMRTKEYNNDLSAWGYIKRRIYKLYPHYFFSFVIMFVSTTVYRSGGITLKNIINALPEVFLIQNIGFFDGGLNYPCWYLSVLIFSCFLIYVLSKMTSKKVFNVVAICCVIFVYSFLAIKYGKIETFSKVLVFYLPLWRGLAGIFLGCLIFELAEKLNMGFYEKYKYGVLRCELIVLLIVILLLFIGKQMDFIELICISGLVILILNQDSIIGKWGKHKAVKWFSRYEYAFFLNHAFIISMYNKVVCDYISFPAIINIIFIVFVLVIYSVITQNIIDIGRKWLKNGVK